MEPIFTMQYAEFQVADYLAKKMKDVSVFVPASAQEKGIDFLLYRFAEGRSQTNTIQVKMSRTYYMKNGKQQFPYHLWFNRFTVQPNAGWYVLVGIYARNQEAGKSAGTVRMEWDTIMLAFTNGEMMRFMEQVRQKKDPAKPDKMFGFGFDDDRKIYQTRGFPVERDMSRYLIENRLEEMERSFS